MIAAIANHLWQSTVFAAVAALLTLAVRKNHPAVRYWIWLAASVKFLLPFAVLLSLGGHFGWHKAHAPAPVASLAVQIFSPQTPVAVRTPAAHIARDDRSLLPVLLSAVWFCGSITVLALWFMRWRRVSGIIRGATPLRQGREWTVLRRLRIPARIVTSGVALEPGVFGIFRPVLFWPAGISERLSDAQLDAILAHEASHIRRQDNLTAAIHMLVEAVFWFYPLVWWIGARLLEERENACDQDALVLQAEPQAYAEGILKICEFCLEAPVLCVAGVSGADLKKRIQAIMAGRVTRELGWPRRIMLAAAACAAIVLPVAIGLLNAPASRAQSQSDSQPLPQFEVASIKPSAAGQAGTFIRPGANGGVNISNMSVKEVITLAWRIQPFQISGGPSWMESAHYDISAKPDHKPNPNEMARMLQSLLADRFQLKTHHETKELPVYALVLANKDGRLGPQLTKSKEGCVMYDTSHPPPPREPGKIPALGCGGMFIGITGVQARAIAIDELMPMLARRLGRTIIDKTKLTGKFDIKLELALDQTQSLSLFGIGPPPAVPGPPASDSNGPSLFTALEEQLGLKIESTKGPVDILVIDSVEKPSEN